MRPWLAVFGLLATLLLPSAGLAEELSGDPKRGAEIYGRCKACHALTRNRTGPKHCGVVGRAAGSVPGFAYSQAMAASGLVWDRETLDRFLEDPLAMIPETTMGYDGVKDALERADLIAYLDWSGRNPKICAP